DLSFNITRGRSTVDWYDKRRLENNAHVLNKIDVKGFFTLLTDLLSRYSTSSLSQQKKGLS
ncbi:MAG: nucleoside hydrolase, partial [Alphaproteobacteria bacterium]|nr:nucleoside hydrolase [Alphaproteobacteria bacterium]